MVFPGRTASTSRKPYVEAKFRLLEVMKPIPVTKFMSKYDLTAKEVAQMLGMTARSVEGWVANGTPSDRQVMLGALSAHFDNAHGASKLVTSIAAFLSEYGGQSFVNIRDKSGLTYPVSAYEYGLRRQRGV
jgi:DNA-binding transcriptional regulator YiaG